MPCGYEGPLCAVCSEGYFYIFSSQLCAKCGTVHVTNIFTILFLAFGVSGILIWIMLFREALTGYKQSPLELKLKFSGYMWRLFVIRFHLVTDNASAAAIEMEAAKWSDSFRLLGLRVKVYTTLFQVAFSSVMLFLCNMIMFMVHMFHIVK